MFKRKLLNSKAHDLFMERGKSPQSERNILLEYRCFQCRNVTLMSYVNKDGSWGQLSQSKVTSCVIISWKPTIINTRLV